MADVLIVEDTPEIALTLADLLAMEGHTVRIACDGREGLAALDERFPDLVVLDIEMPVLDGPAMAAQMLIEDLGRENIPIVLVSGFVDLLAVARRVGTPYAIPKPSTPEDFFGVVNRALLEHTPPRPPPRRQGAP
jgi:CheY-like chemotaxis protein